MIPGYVPAAVERDLEKLARGIRNIYEAALVRIGIGPNVPVAALDINPQGYTLPDPVNPDGIRVGPGSTGYSNLELHSIGGDSAVILKVATGTPSSPCALTADQVLGGFTMRGHDGTGYTTTGRAHFIPMSGENWGASAHGTYWRMQATENGTTTVIPIFDFKPGALLPWNDQVLGGASNEFGGAFFSNGSTATIGGGTGILTVSGRIEMSSASQTFAATTTGAGATAAAWQATSESYAANLFNFNCNTSAASTWNFAVGISDFNGGGSADVEFILRGDGTILSDNAAVTPADYAEFFEWDDGNPGNQDRVGWPVVRVKVNGRSVGRKIRIATVDDDPREIIGIVSARPAVVGDAAPFHWDKKYLKDIWGREKKEPYTVTEIEIWDGSKWAASTLATDRFGKGERFERNGTRYRVIENARTFDRDPKGRPFMRSILNPEFDPSREYVSREERREWVAVGLVGKLLMRAGAPVKQTWIKLADHESQPELHPSVELWLIGV